MRQQGGGAKNPTEQSYRALVGQNLFLGEMKRVTVRNSSYANAPADLPLLPLVRVDSRSRHNMKLAVQPFMFDRSRLGALQILPIAQIRGFLLQHFQRRGGRGIGNILASILSFLSLVP